MQPDGKYKRLKPGPEQERIDVQEWLMVNGSK
jgi:hypothetical protein